jgi:hypothetical protein
VHIQKGDEWKTTLKIHYDHFEYVVISFGLTNALVVFQHMMNDVFYEYLDDFVVCNIDDILIFSKNMADHERHVGFVLKKLQKVSLYAKLEKCGFHQFEVEFLGYIIFGDGVCMEFCKVQTIVGWATLTFVQDVHCFYAFANFYCQFIAHYSIIMTFFTCLTKKDQPFSWGVKVEIAFQSLKASFTTDPLLIHADLSKPFVLEIDVCDFALNVVFSQPGKNNLLHPIGFCSCKFFPMKFDYKIHDKKNLAIVDAFEEWHHLLEGVQHEITMYYNHKNLQYFVIVHVLNQCQALWALSLF